MADQLALHTTDVADLRRRREAIVNEHAEVENRHDVTATIATFHEHARYEFNGAAFDGESAVRQLLQGFMDGFPDFHIAATRIRHLDDGVLVEGMITGTHSGSWAGLAPTGRGIEVPVVGIFEFDGDRLLCEKVHMDMATVFSQLGASPIP
jgi:steroid delta-isomerase-like uncharacterized protein